MSAKKPAKKGGDQQMAYLTAAVESLVKKGLEKAMKGKKRKHNRTYDSSSILILNRELGPVTWG